MGVLIGARFFFTVTTVMDDVILRKLENVDLGSSESHFITLDETDIVEGITEYDCSVVIHISGG